MPLFATPFLIIAWISRQSLSDGPQRFLIVLRSLNDDTLSTFNWTIFPIQLIRNYSRNSLLAIFLWQKTNLYERKWLRLKRQLRFFLSSSWSSRSARRFDGAGIHSTVFRRLQRPSRNVYAFLLGCRHRKSTTGNLPFVLLFTLVSFTIGCAHDVNEHRMLQLQP